MSGSLSSPAHVLWPLTAHFLIFLQWYFYFGCFLFTKHTLHSSLLHTIQITIKGSTFPLRLSSHLHTSKHFHRLLRALTVISHITGDTSRRMIWICIGLLSPNCPLIQFPICVQCVCDTRHHTPTTDWGGFKTQSDLEVRKPNWALVLSLLFQSMVEDHFMPMNRKT